MLYAGGWVDVDLLPSSSSEIEVEYHELDDVEEFATLLDRVASRLVLRLIASGPHQAGASNAAGTCAGWVFAVTRPPGGL